MLHDYKLKRFLETFSVIGAMDEETLILEAELFVTQDAASFYSFDEEKQICFLLQIHIAKEGLATFIPFGIDGQQLADPSSFHSLDTLSLSYLLNYINSLLPHIQAIFRI